MLFNSWQFWVFCLSAVGAYHLTPTRWRWAVLLAASYIFYGSFGTTILPVLLVQTLVVYGLSLAMDRAEGTRRKVLLLATIAVPLTALVVFKYATLIWTTILAIAGRPGGEPINILVPIGISFYVFKLLSYTLDVYHQRVPVEKHLGYLAVYVAYFPQILAGPIERSGQFLPQLRAPERVQPSAFGEAGRLILWGLFKKLVVADRLSFYVGEMFLAPEGKGLHLLFSAYFYYIQIYCDFSGYSDLSVGLSRALGLRPPLNFNYPYLSRDLSQFWTRWHITLSTWLRDYLFLPIAYAVERRVAEVRALERQSAAWSYSVASMVTMVLGGLWHGAAWTFVAWGALHGFYLVVAYWTKRARNRVWQGLAALRITRLRQPLAVFITFHLVTLAWILFRASSFDEAHRYLKYLQFRLPTDGVVNLLFNALIVAVFLACEYVQRNRRRLLVLDRVPMEVRAAGYAFAIVVLIAFSADAANPFIYFRF